MSGVDPLAYRAAIIAALAAGLPGMDGLNKVAAHGGAITGDLLKRYAQDAPCLRVALTAFGPAASYSSGGFMLPAHVSIIVITKDTASEGAGRVGRDAAAAALASAVTGLCRSNRWNLDGVEQPQQLQAQNEFSGDIDALGVAAWQVTFIQSVLLGDDFETAIADLSKLYLNGVEFAEGADPLLTAARGPVAGDPIAPQRPLEPIL